MATKCFIGSDNLPCVAGIVVAGPGELKDELVARKYLDQRLRNIVLRTVDTAYDGKNGFYEALRLSADVSGSVARQRAADALASFFQNLAMDKQVALGTEEVFYALEQGAASVVLLSEHLKTVRYTLQHKRHTHGTPGDLVEHIHVHYTPPSAATTLPGHRVTDVSPHVLLAKAKTAKKAPGYDESMSSHHSFDIVQAEPLVDYLAENYKSYGAKVVLIPPTSEKGSQFHKTFGIAALLRYDLDFSYLHEGPQDQDHCDAHSSEEWSSDWDEY